MLCPVTLCDLDYGAADRFVVKNNGVQGGASAPASKGKKGKKGGDAAPAGASSVSSGVKLENVSTANLFLIVWVQCAYTHHIWSSYCPHSASI